MALRFQRFSQGLAQDPTARRIWFGNLLRGFESHDDIANVFIKNIFASPSESISNNFSVDFRNLFHVAWQGNFESLGTGPFIEYRLFWCLSVVVGYTYNRNGNRAFPGSKMPNLVESFVDSPVPWLGQGIWSMESLCSNPDSNGVLQYRQGAKETIQLFSKDSILKQNQFRDWAENYERSFRCTYSSGGQLGRGHRNYDTINNSLHFQLDLALASLGVITSLELLLMELYFSLEITIREQNEDNVLARMLDHKEAIISHLSWASLFLGFHTLGLCIHNDVMLAFGTPEKQILIEPIFAQWIQSLMMRGSKLYQIKRISVIFFRAMAQDEEGNVSQFNESSTYLMGWELIETLAWAHERTPLANLILRKINSSLSIVQTDGGRELTIETLDYPDPFIEMVHACCQSNSQCSYYDGAGDGFSAHRAHNLEVTGSNPVSATSCFAKLF
ncbi:hypothetical protein HAX54_016177 [Datura stramonium]|uniref:Uncharacterized protein n=1 Tax=Datura stramonium TaxID=4076 RepID=A0ABS8UK25_DATST|nr:hypothetical protein [Datura stramonium]